MIGSAVGKLVDSIATADTIVNSDMKARRNRLVGFHPSLPRLIELDVSSLGTTADASISRGLGVISIVVGVLVRKGTRAKLDEFLKR